jgi:hypothetical protein
MRLRIEYSTSDYIEIELFDNPTVKKWFQHFQKINNDVPNFYKNQRVVQNGEELYLQSHYEKHNIHWQQIKHTIKKLQNIGYNFPFEIPESFNFDQSTLNKLHRIFTYNMLWSKDRSLDSNPFDSSFALPIHISHKDWHTLLDIINDAVHSLENYTNESDIRKFVHTQYPIDYLFFSPIAAFNTWLEFNADDIKQNLTYMQHPDDNPLVLLNDSILGKSIFQSFYDDDDPTCKDCTGRLGSHGGFIIDNNFNRKQLYKTLEFTQWLNRYQLNAETVPYEFPIGTVSSSSNSLELLAENYQNFSKIIFIE